MNSGKAGGVVTSCAIFTFALGWFYTVKNGGTLPSAKFMIGLGVTFLGLEVVSDISPELASALAVAIATTSFFHYGQTLIDYVDSAPKTSKTDKTSSKQTSGTKAAPTSGTGSKKKPSRTTKGS